jgi:hypothetical protein
MLLEASARGSAGELRCSEFGLVCRSDSGEANSSGRELAQRGRWRCPAAPASGGEPCGPGDRVLAAMLAAADRIATTGPHRGQGEPFPVSRHHAEFSGSPFVLDRRSPITAAIRVAIKPPLSLIAGPLAHLPSGRFNAIDDWPTWATITQYPAQRRSSRRQGSEPGPPGDHPGTASSASRPASLLTPTPVMAVAHRAGHHLHRCP